MLTLKVNHIQNSKMLGHQIEIFAKNVQESGSTELIEESIGKAVSSGMVDNETLGYFIARIYLF